MATSSGFPDRIWLALGHLVTGFLLMITIIIGIPLALANFKLISISLAPLGKGDCFGLTNREKPSRACDAADWATACDVSPAASGTSWLQE